MSIAPPDDLGPAPLEPTWAVLVVHGVGLTRPGLTLQAFMQGLRQSVPHLQESEPPEVRMLPEPDPVPPPHSPVPLTPPAGPVILAGRFPMHLRWAQVNQPRNGTPAKVVLAEVFWSDLSGTRYRGLALLVRLVTVIFHLRYVADRAARVPGRLARWLRFFLFFASWLLCGPIAGLSAVILILLVASYVRQFLENVFGGSLTPQGLNFTMVGLGLATAVLGGGLVLAARRRDWDSPWQLLAWSIGITGLAVLVLASWLSLSPDTLWEGRAGRFLETRFGPIRTDLASVYFAALVLLTQLLFALVAILVHLAALTWLCAVLANLGRKSRHFVPGLTAALGALMLQIGLWVLIIPALAIWGFYQFFPDPLSKERSPFEPVQSSFLLDLGLAVIVLVALLVVCVVRCVWGWRHQQDYHKLLVARTIPRLLIHWFLLGILLLISLFGCFVTWYSFLTGSRAFYDPLVPLVEGSGLWIAAAVTLIGLFLLNPLGAGLHILMDIIGHFYQRGLRVPWPWQDAEKLDHRELVTQMRIEARCRRVLQEVLELGNVTYLTVVSHSQGTVIAIDVLWFDWAERLLEGKQVNLVTMGSPFTHLYQHYFPLRYPELFLNGKFNSSKETGWGLLSHTVSSWWNVFRVDDFVGTYSTCTFRHFLLLTIKNTSLIRSRARRTPRRW